MKYLRSIGLLIGIVLSAGCASIVKGPTQEIGISSSPMNARVTVDGGQIFGATPVVARLDRDRHHFVTVSKPGYEARSVAITSEFSPLAIIGGNLISWGPVGMLVDLASGSSYDLTPDAVDVSLTPTADLNQTQLPTPASNQVVVTAASAPLLARPQPSSPPVMHAARAEIFTVKSVTPDWVEVSPPDHQQFWVYARRGWFHGSNRIVVRSGAGDEYAVLGTVTPKDVSPVGRRRVGWIQVRIRPPSSLSLWVSTDDVRGPNIDGKNVEPEN